MSESSAVMPPGEEAPASTAGALPDGETVLETKPTEVTPVEATSPEQQPPVADPPVVAATTTVQAAPDFADAVRRAQMIAAQITSAPAATGVAQPASTAHIQGPPSHSGFSDDEDSKHDSSSHGDNSIMDVPAHMAGLIIGRGGETIRRIQDQSGARVQITPESNTPNRRISITGTPANIARARDLISDVMEGERRGSGPGGPHSFSGPPIGGMGGGAEGIERVEIETPRHKVGLIIGRGGEKIRELEERTGARIQIAQDNPNSQDMKLATITGPRAAVEHAKKLIETILKESDRFHDGPGYDPRDRREPVPSVGSRREDMNLPGKFNENPFGAATLEMVVPSHMVGHILGTGGSTIKALQADTGTRITLGKDMGPERDLKITGLGESVREAQKIIISILDDAMKLGGGRRPTMPMGVGVGGPPSYGRDFPGDRDRDRYRDRERDRGDRERDRRDSHERDRDGDHDYTGDRGNRERERDYGRDRDRRDSEYRGDRDRNDRGDGGYGPAMDTIPFRVPADKVGFVIGKGGESIRQIEEHSGARVQLEKFPQPGAPDKAFMITGTPSQIEAAKKLVCDRMSEGAPMAGYGGPHGGYSGRPSGPPGGFGGFSSTGGPDRGGAPPAPWSGAPPPGTYSQPPTAPGGYTNSPSPQQGYRSQGGSGGYSQPNGNGYQSSSQPPRTNESFGGYSQGAPAANPQGPQPTWSTYGASQSPASAPQASRPGPPPPAIYNASAAKDQAPAATPANGQPDYTAAWHAYYAQQAAAGAQTQSTAHVASPSTGTAPTPIPGQTADTTAQWE
eukprot:Ihof_evm10s82 gene=Ihof_evmTU10s82